jgi:acyl carrier protein
MSTADCVKQVIAEHLGIEQVQDSDTFEGLGLDSLDGTEIAMQLEERLSVEIEQERFESIMATGMVEQLIKYMKELNDG